ncbi:fumarylacetoacetate hydrolase family protein [Gorillibacterium massiliense]|uniref:fumarylacetoacetate hydrolase family protein n=1 Tax=Gorillibacterium massiliense TaxID=1280390 RepID=UPI0004AD4816|nr:fumarylacetoacetate hydrolase family protein [Gorillibacterium massiliense]
MFTDVRNVYCVGRNYRLHAAELGNDVPKSPMLFTKPTHSLVQAEGNAIALPGDRGDVHYEAELVLHIGRDYEPGMRVEELVDKLAIGIDFTLRDVQSELKEKGLPWLAAKGFLGSAPIGRFFPYPAAGITQVPFSLSINGVEKQRGTAAEMIFDPQTLVEFIAARYGLGAGDLIFTGTPAGVGPVTDGDTFELFWNGEEVGSFQVKLAADDAAGKKA